MDEWTSSSEKIHTYFLFHLTPNRFLPPFARMNLPENKRRLPSTTSAFASRQAFIVIAILPTNEDLLQSLVLMRQKPASFSKYTSMSHAVPLFAPPLNMSTVIYFESFPQTGRSPSQHICVYSTTHAPCLHVSVEYFLFLTAKSATFSEMCDQRIIKNIDIVPGPSLFELDEMERT